MQREPMYIDGKWVESASGRWAPVEDPATGRVFAEVADGVAADADRAVAAARRAFEEGPWPRFAPEERREHLLRLHRLLVERSGSLAEVIRRDAGATVRVAAAMQVGGGLHALPPIAEQALLLRPRGSVIQETPSFGHSEIRREPIGVCAAFVPFNFPLMVANVKLVSALAMGNTVVLKPSPLAPLAVVELVRACHDAGIPPGVVNLVCGDREPAQRLTRHPEVDLISFTGSTETGRRIMASAAGGIKRVILELGGKAPIVILDDADLDFALRGAALSAFLHSGQICGCGTRLLAPAQRLDEVVERICRLARELRIGPTDDPATDLGPLISAGQRERVERIVAEAVASGARVRCGGRRPAEPAEGYYFEPTVLTDLRPELRAVREEIFGPVLVAMPYETDDEAVALANDSDYGLSATVWGSDLLRARAVASRIRAGSVWINDWGVGHPPAPWGGLKQSGLGYEHGEEGVFAYTQLRHVYTSLDRDPARRAFALGSPRWA